MCARVRTGRPLGRGCRACSAEAQGRRAGGGSSPDTRRRAKGSHGRASRRRMDLAQDRNVSCAPPPAPHFPQHLFTIEVPVVYNHQFDKFGSSLLIIIISLHSAPLREFNDSINNRRTMVRNLTTRSWRGDFLLLSGKLRDLLVPPNPKLKINQGRKKRPLADRGGQSPDQESSRGSRRSPGGQPGPSPGALGRAGRSFRATCPACPGVMTQTATSFRPSLHRPFSQVVPEFGSSASLTRTSLSVTGLLASTANSQTCQMARPGGRC